MKNSLSIEFLDRQRLPGALVRTIRELGEFRGKQDLFRQQSPQVLETLRQASMIESAESSNRLEGIEAPYERIADMVQKGSKPKNRPEQEIAGYRDALNTIHASHEHMPLTTGVVRQLHRDLYKFSTKTGGHWKATNNEITEKHPDGTKVTRFKPVSALATPDAMETLHRDLATMLASEEVEPLLIIPAYVLDFLCIHPFSDGNGRCARLLTLLLLYKSGYEVGRFISLEQMVEKTKDSYYGTLYESSKNWHGQKHDLVPWWEYFLGVMLLGAYRQFADRVGSVKTVKGAKREMIVAAVERLPAEFQFADVERLCPGISRPTFNRALAELRKAGKITCIKGGRDAVWKKR